MKENTKPILTKQSSIQNLKVNPSPVRKQQNENLPFPTSIPDLVLWSLRFVAPFSSGVLLVKLISWFVGYKLPGKPKTFTRKFLGRIINLWLASETLFYLYCSMKKMQSQLPNPNPEKLTAKERMEIFERCLKTVVSPRYFCSSWMRNHPFEKLKIGNIEEWLSWGLFSKRYEEVLATKGEKNSGEITEYQQLQNVITRFEDACGHEFEPGHDCIARPMQFTLEPVETLHRPLLYYGVVQGLFQHGIVPAYMRSNGFKLKTCDSGGLYCWMREGTGYPIVFLHGIGVGLLPYLGFVRKLIHASDGKYEGDNEFAKNLHKRPLIFVELPIVSQSITVDDSKLLQRGKFCKDMENLLNVHCGYTQGCFVGHSYGTICLSWLVSRAPHVLKTLVFIDPVVFLLHHTRALNAICYNQPLDRAGRLMHYIMRTELVFSSFTRRYFFWYANILFLEQIPSSCPTAIIVSTNDDIVPSQQVAEYIHREAHNHIKLEVLDGATHGEYLWNSECNEIVFNTLCANCKC